MAGGVRDGGPNKGDDSGNGDQLTNQNLYQTEFDGLDSRATWGEWVLQSKSEERRLTGWKAAMKETLPKLILPKSTGSSR